MESHNALNTLREQALLTATHRSTIQEALNWIAEGHALDSSSISEHQILDAALAAEEAGYPSRDAIFAMSRRVARSGLDPATMLFEPGLMPNAAALRASLDVLATKCSSGSLGLVSATAVRTAQHVDRGVIDVLCALAGITYDELRDRVGGSLPSEARGNWTTDQLNAAFVVIDSIVRGTGPPVVTGSIPSRPVELVQEVTGVSLTAWDRIEELRTDGVPYELLLAQRIVGSAWGQHRNRTSTRPTRAVALDLRQRILRRGFDAPLVSGHGGDASQADINEMVGGSGDIGLVARTSDTYQPFFAVAFTLAKDGGSARKSGSTKIKMERPRVPLALVVLGPGWAERRETADLVRAFKGLVFTETTLDELVDTIAEAAPKELSQ